MSNLLTTENGRAAMRQAAIDVIHDRIKRWFQRNTVIEFNSWIVDGVFDIGNVLASLNVEHDSEIYDLFDLLNYLLAGSSTVEDRQFWVDPINGSDATGIGSLTQPFASLEFLKYSIPETVEHEIRVTLAAGTYSQFPDLLLSGHLFKGDGRIVIDASGSTYPVVAGPFTINAVSGVGPVGPDGASLATDVQAVGAPGWVVNAYHGSFIHFLDGALAGQVFGIYSNTADTIRMGVDWYGALPGDTFNIVSCPAVFNMTERLIIQGCTNLTNRSYNALALGDQDSPMSSYLYICGCEFSFLDSIASTCIIEDISCFFSFVKFSNRWITNSSSRVIEFKNTIITSNPIDNTIFDNNALTDWYTANFYTSAKSGGIDPNCLGVRYVDSLFGNHVCNHTISLVDSSFYSLMCLRIDSQHTCEYAYAFFQQFPASATANKHYHGRLYVISAYFVDVLDALISYYSDMRIDWAQGSGITGTDAVILYEGFCRVYINNVASVTVTGTVNVYLFQFTGVGAAAWPAIGASVNDTHGSWIKVKS